MLFQILLESLPNVERLIQSDTTNTLVRQLTSLLKYETKHIIGKTYSHLLFTPNRKSHIHKTFTSEPLLCIFAQVCNS